MHMKKIRILVVTLVITSLACATYESLLGGENEASSIPTPTSFPTLQPTTPVDTLAPTSTQISASPTALKTEEMETAEATVTATLGPTPTLAGDPVTRNFFTCAGPCLADGANDQGSFTERTEIVYFQFEYENFPVGASYTRWWTLNGVEWARYQCAWPGPQSGLEQITLTEPNGLASGTWQVTITIDGVIVLQEILVVQGSWSYWDPAGFFSACYGKR
jgi:hypothetical protein